MEQPDKPKSEGTAQPNPGDVSHTVIKRVDLMVEANSERHHTDKYEMCQESYIDDITGKVNTAQLIVRRGQEFRVKLFLNKDYSSRDQFRVVASIGSRPLVSKGTIVEMLTDKSYKDKKWCANVLSSSTEEVELSVYPPPTCGVGRWSLSFDTVSLEEGGAIVPFMDAPVTSHAYIIFNAWCTDDAVYMEHEDWRKEYVLNDSGKVYRGDVRKINGMPWNFGQFESVSLQTALFLLDEHYKLALTTQGNVISVSRALSALVDLNACDDNGILVPNWSGDYPGGVPPTRWTGSPAILQKYMESRKPVKYGQCWVFSAVLTTLCRALGIPTRSVTNFISAYDTDCSLTIDKHYTVDGVPETDLDSDSIWNFHVWNECWMSRPDLPAGYGGWQVVDPTPQQLIHGMHRAGPASVVGIKNGDVGHNYDSKYIFAEVNADRVLWFKQRNGGYEKQIQKNVVGKNISTKARGPSKAFNSHSYTPDREDITNQYKHPEGSHEERTAALRATMCSTKPRVCFEEASDQDVRLGILSDTNFDREVGDDFEVSLVIENTSSSERNIKLTATLSSVYYAGTHRKNLKRETHEVKVPAESKQCVALTVKASDYMNDLVDFGYAMKIDYVGSVQETRQILASQEDLRLRTLVPDVTASKDSLMIGETFNVAVRFRNPLQKPLTGCSFTFESAGNLKPVSVNISDVKPGATAESGTDMVAKRAGDIIVITGFECNEIGDMQGQASVHVTKK